MNEERRKELNEDGSAHLTDEEVAEGYYFCFCISGDGMLCHRDTPEPGCTCNADTKPAPAKEQPTKEDNAAFAMLAALHSNIPEEQRPMGWCDLTDDQAKRVRAAVQAVAIELSGTFDEKVLRLTIKELRAQIEDLTTIKQGEKKCRPN